MIFTFTEILYYILSIFVIAYIFSDRIKIPTKPQDILDLYKKRRRFNWNNLWFAAIVTAPAIILHELAHKFAAIAYGFTAFYEIFPLGLGIGLLLKIIGAPFILIAPGYVSIASAAGAAIPPSQLAIIAFAGPFVNLVLWLSCHFILKYKQNLKRKTVVTLYITKQINMILFIFNMIPFGPLDGAKVLSGLVNAF